MDTHPGYIPQKECFESLQGPEKRNERRRLWYHYHRMGVELSEIAFLCSHDKWRREIIKDMFHSLDRISPDAFDLLVKYGVEYTSKAWREAPGFGEPIPGRCHANSWELMDMINQEIQDQKLEPPETERATYVEGITFGPHTNPMLHAWNAKGLTRKNAIDWTFYSVCQWLHYYGIPLTQSERETAQRLVCPNHPKTITLLLEKRRFPKIKSFLIDVLEKRREEKRTNESPSSS